MRTERSVHHKHLHVQGFSRLLWIGKLSKVAGKNGSARIRVYWAEVDINPKDRNFDSCPIKPGAEIKSVDLPIGYLTLLHINAIFYQGEIVSPWPNGKLPFEKRTNGPQLIDFSRENLTFFNRHDKDELQEQILQVKGNYLREMKAAADSKCFGVRIGDDPYAIIFPCAEVLRFFYCTSSTMANVIFDGRIQRPEEHLYNSSEGKSFGPTDGHVFITLRKKMLDSDARVIASLFADPELRKYTAEIADAVSTQEGDFRDVIAYPPFDGEMLLEFFYVPVIINGHTRKFVTRIIHSYNRPSFSTMEFDRDLNAEPDPNDATGGEVNTPDENQLDDAEEDNPPILSDGTFLDPQVADELRRAELGHRFPELASTPCHKVPSQSKNSGNRRQRLKYIKTMFKEHTTAEGAGSTDVPLRKLNIQAPGNNTFGTTESKDIDATIGAIAYLRTIKYLEVVREKKLAGVTYVKDILPHFTLIDGVYFNVYPIKSKDFFPRQTFQLIDKFEKKSRLVLIAQLEVDGKTRFLIDFQQRQEKELSYQVFWFESEVVPSNAIVKLKEALYSYAATKTAGGAYVNVIGLSWGSFKHKHENVSDDWIINQVFNTKRK